MGSNNNNNNDNNNNNNNNNYVFSVKTSTTALPKSMNAKIINFSTDKSG